MPTVSSVLLAEHDESDSHLHTCTNLWPRSFCVHILQEALCDRAAHFLMLEPLTVIVDDSPFESFLTDYFNEKVVQLSIFLGKCAHLQVVSGNEKSSS